MMVPLAFHIRTPLYVKASFCFYSTVPPDDTNGRFFFSLLHQQCCNERCEPAPPPTLHAIQTIANILSVLVHSKSLYIPWHYTNLYSHLSLTLRVLIVYRHRSRIFQCFSALLKQLSIAL